MSLRTALQAFLVELNTDYVELTNPSHVADLRKELRSKEKHMAQAKAQEISENLVAAEELSAVIDALTYILEENEDTDDEDDEDEDFSLEEIAEDEDVEPDEEY